MRGGLRGLIKISAHSKKSHSNVLVTDDPRNTDPYVSGSSEFYRYCSILASI